MKVNRFVCMFLTFILFFGFLKNVEAKTFYCTYKFRTNLSFMIEQADGKKPVYKVSKKGAVKPTAKSWKTSNLFVASYHGSNTTPYKVCPPYASYYKDEFKTSYTVDFRENVMSSEQVKALKGSKVANVAPSYNNSSNKDSIESADELGSIGLITKEVEKIDSCSKLFGTGESAQELIDLLKTGVTILRILVPILIIGMGILDMAQGIFSFDDQQMKKAQSKFIKRLIIGVGFFLIPSVLQVLLTIGSNVWPDAISSDFCGIL